MKLSWDVLNVISSCFLQIRQSNYGRQIPFMQMISLIDKLINNSSPIGRNMFFNLNKVMSRALCNIIFSCTSIIVKIHFYYLFFSFSGNVLLSISLWFHNSLLKLYFFPLFLPHPSPRSLSFSSSPLSLSLSAHAEKKPTYTYCVQLTTKCKR